MLFIGNKRSLLWSGLSLAGKIRKLFSASQPGAWHDYGLFNQQYQDSTGTVPVTAVEQPLGKVNDQSGRGNHLTQATAPARPVVSGRVNLLSKTEDFGDVSWAKNNVTLTQNNSIAPDGTLTACRLDASVDSESYLYQYCNGVGGVVVSASVYVKAGTSTVIEIQEAWYVGDKAVFNLSDGTVISGAGSIEPAANGYYRCTLFSQRSVGQTIYSAFFKVLAAGNIYIWHPQVEESVASTRYQHINTSTDYDTAGFPAYARFDGVDDFMSSATGGGATTGFFWCGAVKLLSGAGVEQHIWSDLNGANGYLVAIHSVNGGLLFAAGNGTAYTFSASAVPLVLGTTTLLTAWDDGTNLNIQINNGAVSSVARPVVTAGTTGFTEGKNNTSAGNYFNGNIYPSIYRTGTPLTAAERAAAQAWCKSKAGL